MAEPIQLSIRVNRKQPACNSTDNYLRYETLHTHIVPGPNIRGQDDTRYSAES